MFRCIVWSLLCLSATSIADWSPPILLWQNPDSVEPGDVQAAIAIDSSENVHIIYSYRFQNSAHRPLDGLNYTKFDDRGNRLVPDVRVNSNREDAVGRQQIGLFRGDSLWIMWFADQRLYPEFSGYRSRCFDLNGNALSSVRNWPDLPFGQWSGFTFRTTAEGKAVIFYVADDHTMRAIVRNPDGTDLMNHTIVYQDSRDFDWPDCAITESDMAVLMWRNRIGWLNDKIFAKWVDVAYPFDSSLVNDADSLTPDGEVWGQPLLLPRIGVNIALTVGTLRGWPHGDWLWLRSLEGFSLIADANLGVSDAGKRRKADHEPGMNVISAHGIFEHFQSRFKQFDAYDLTELSDSVFIRWGVFEGFSICYYAVSPGGVRHFFYTIEDSEYTRLYYRYWRSDLGTEQQPSPRQQTAFRIWPNPASDGLQIDGPLQRVKEISLFNILGQQIWSGLPTPDQKLSIPDFRHLPNGSYYIHLHETSGSVVQRIIIQH